MAAQLPIDEHLASIASAVQSQDSVVIKAEPGAGKTTRVPVAVEKVVTGKTLVLEPRRLAAKLSATHIAATRGEQVGESVGYQIRYDRKVSAQTSVIFLTEGMFIRMLMDDPQLADVGCVILDEFHERNLNTDLALGAVRFLQKTQRKELKLVVMSATIDVSALERYLGECATFAVAGRQFPVATEYFPTEQRTDLSQTVARACKELLQDKRCDRSVLVFLPGTREIMEAKDRCLKQLKGMPVSVVPLTAELPSNQQNMAFDESKRRVILATNVAETSLTIPGVTGVVDTGLAKIAGHAHWSGMPTLETKDVSKASAIQRGGRAGRVHPGVVYRTYDEASFLARDDYTLPEVKRVDLTSCALQILALKGVIWPEAEQFPWFEQPDERLWESAFALLGRLDLIDEREEITEFGRDVFQVPLHPRPAAVFAKARLQGHTAYGALVAALISEGFLLRGLRQSVDKRTCDVTYQLEILRALWRKEDLPSERLEAAIDHRRMQRIVRLADMLAKSKVRNFIVENDLPAQALVAEWLLAGFSDRVAKMRVLDKKRQLKQRRPMYHFCLGRGGTLGEQSVLGGKEAFIIAVDAQENLKQSNAAKATTIRVASQVSREQLMAHSSGGFISKKQEERPGANGGLPDQYIVTYYGEFSVAEEKLEEEGGSAQILAKMLTDWPWPFADQQDLVTHNHKARLLAEHKWPVQLTEFSGEMLELLIHAIGDDAKSLKGLLARPLKEYIFNELSYEEHELLRTVVPDKLRLGNGQELELTYDEYGCSARGFIQDFFGEANSPNILDGRVPVRLFLLAPNKRPAQVTTDLSGFWKAGYFEVRKELYRRYPRHYWPDDPADAQPFLTKKRATRGN